MMKKFHSTKKTFSDVITQKHIACPCGISSDAFCIYDDGHGTCYRCKAIYHNLDPNSPDIIYLKEKELTDKKEEPIATSTGYDPSPIFAQFPNGARTPPVEDQVPEPEKIVDLIDYRGITKHVYDFFNVRFKLAQDGKTPLEICYPYDNGVFKIRRISDKSFYTKGPIKDVHLFGKHRFDPGAFKTITITEGEQDAMAVYQMLNGMSACVSVRNAATAKNDCMAEWDYINSFDKIILCLDNDDAGNEATRSIVPLFDFNKVFYVDMMRHKDANDYLMANETPLFAQAWQNAKRYTPDNVISSYSEIEASLNSADEDRIGTYPFKGLQDKLYGLHRGEVVVFKGDEGIGKTEVLRAIEYHILKTEKDRRLALFHLEEDNAMTVRALATYEDQFPYVHPEHKGNKEAIMTAYKKLTEGREDKVYIYESFDVEDEKAFFDHIRFLTGTCGCDVVVLDHITWLATGGHESEDERRKLDRISQGLKLLSKELRFCLIEISHTNDEGKARGSRNITKVANTVIHMSRDLTNPNEEESKKLHFMIEKARAGGNTGYAGFAMFDKETLRLIDPVEMNTFKLPGVA